MSAANELPDFIAVGPPRAATTWLDRVLRGHAGLPRDVKETRYFSANYGLGLDWYKAHFKGMPPGRPTGEIVATYFDHSAARERIHDLLPECRIICTLRDPVKRLYSHYCQLRHEGWIGNRTLAQALSAHERWSDQPGNMFGISRYADHVGHWRWRFGAERVLVTIFDDLEADPQSFLDRVCDFIGLARFELARSPVGPAPINQMTHAPKNPHLARRARKLRDGLERRRFHRLVNLCHPLFEFCFGGGEKFGPIDPAIESQLRDRLRPQVEALEALIDRDLSSWKSSTHAGRPGRGAASSG